MGDPVIDYLTDDSHDIAHAAAIRPVLHEVADDVLACDSLTWGTCYGDGPEALRTPAGEMALIDWSGVLYAPLLWDVADWAACVPNPQAFVAACQLRFRAWRPARRPLRRHA